MDPSKPLVLTLVLEVVGPLTAHMKRRLKIVLVLLEVVHTNPYRRRPLPLFPHLSVVRQDPNIAIALQLKLIDSPPRLEMPLHLSLPPRL